MPIRCCATACGWYLEDCSPPREIALIWYDPYYPLPFHAENDAWDLMLHGLALTASERLSISGKSPECAPSHCASTCIGPIGKDGSSALTPASQAWQHEPAQLEYIRLRAPTSMHPQSFNHAWYHSGGIQLRWHSAGSRGTESCMSHDTVLTSCQRALIAYMSKNERGYYLAGQPPKVVIVPASMHSDLGRCFNTAASLLPNHQTNRLPAPAGTCCLACGKAGAGSQEIELESTQAQTRCLQT